MENRNTAPVGVFDSGVGGLTVATYISGIQREFHTEANRRIRLSAFRNRSSVF